MSTMTDAEKEMLHSCIEKSGCYLEFGSGESTAHAAGVESIRRVVSVESSAGYINDHLKGDPVIAAALASGKLAFHVVDIGETIAWGEPKDNSKKHLWPNYALSVFVQPQNFDLVLVDGRFRVACVLNSLLNTDDDCTIVIHDFWNRPEYGVVLEFLETERRVDTLGVFRRKGGIRAEKVQAMIRKYQYLPRDKTSLYKLKEKLTKHFR